MEITASDGKHYQTLFYSLDAIIAVGYRVNSVRATQFRQWATSVLKVYAIRGYVLDRKRMENGTFLNGLLTGLMLVRNTWDLPLGRMRQTERL